MESSHVLVVHSEAAVRQLAAACLEQDRLRVSLAGGDEEGLSLLEKERVHVLVTAVDALGRGEEFVRRAATIQPLLGIVLLADPGRVNHAGQQPQGPIQYLTKPVTRDALRSAVAKALERQFKRSPLQGVASPAAGAGGQGCAAAFVDAEHVVAASKAMSEILELVCRCAPTDAPVLICGEPGTRKETPGQGDPSPQPPRRRRRWCGSPAGPSASRNSPARSSDTTNPAAKATAAPPAGCGSKPRAAPSCWTTSAQLPPWAQVALLDMLQQGRSGRRRPAQTCG